VIDQDSVRFRLLEKRFDLRDVVGNGIRSWVLKEAWARDAYTLIAGAGSVGLRLGGRRVSAM
jgi:Trk K+ transport system NAD-binding subunit